MAAKKLTPKQRQFCKEYLVDLNATQAAIRAGYSSKTASRIAIELLNKTHVQDYIQKLMSEREKRTEVTQDMIVIELAKIAFGDLRGSMVWGPHGVQLIASSQLADEDAAAIAEVSETTTKAGGSVKIKRYDKVKALELLGKHVGMFGDKSEGSSSTLADAIAEAYRRRK